VDVDLQAAILSQIPGITARGANYLKNIDFLEDAYTMAALCVRQACLLQLSGHLVKTPMVPFLEQVVASLVCTQIAPKISLNSF